MPAIPLQVQTFSILAGANESIDSINLSNMASTGGVSNVWMDKYGRATRILGYTAVNTAYRSHTGSNATQGRGLFQYRTIASGITRQILSVWDDGSTHYDIAYSNDNGVTNTYLTDLGATSVGAVPIFAQFGNVAYLTNGKATPQQYDGTTMQAAGKTQSPTPASAAGSAGNLQGVYIYKLVSINADKSRQYASAASAALTVTNSQISVTWTADTDVTKVGYELYRTTGSGSVLYLVAYIDGRTTVAYTDNILDLTILQNPTCPVYGDPPPTTYFCVPHKQRMWWLRSDTYPTRGYYSDPGLADSVYQAINFIDFSDSNWFGDLITGGIGDFNGMLVVGTQRSLWRVSGTGQVISNAVDWQKTRSNAQTGWVSQRSVVRVPTGAKYVDAEGTLKTLNANMLAYFTPVEDIRVFDGDNDEVISLPKKTTLSTVNHTYQHKTWAVHDTFRSEITWVYPDGVSTECNAAVTWNYRWGTWYDRTWPFAHAIEPEDLTGTNNLLAQSPSSATGGYIYKLWNGNSFAGANITAQWMTKTIYGLNMKFGDGIQLYQNPLMSHEKRWRWCDLLVVNTGGDFTVEWLPGDVEDDATSFGSATVDPSQTGIFSSAMSSILSGSGSTITISGLSTTTRVILNQGRYLHSLGMRLRISDTSTSSPWSLEGINVAFQVLPGLQRRMQS